MTALKSAPADTDKFDAQLKSLGADIVALKKQGNPSAAIERFEQDMIVLKSVQDNRPAAAQTRPILPSSMRSAARSPATSIPFRRRSRTCNSNCAPGSNPNTCGRGLVVARGLAPVGLRSGPKTSHRESSGTTRVPDLRLLRSRTGASPLATKAFTGLPWCGEYSYISPLPSTLLKHRQERGMRNGVSA